jgi:hypothetical protein
MNIEKRSGNMEFVKENVMGIAFVVMVIFIMFLGTWSNKRMEYNSELEQQEYLSANLY